MQTENESSKLVQHQFGRSAQFYVDSKVHAKGEDLQRLVEMTDAQPDWRLLDIATGGGHTAFAFAPLVTEVVATDFTNAMLQAAQAEAERRRLNNIRFEYADALALPFPAASFDCVTCRVATHHFSDVFQFLRESRRVLRPGGTIAISDNHVPEGPAGDYINAFEKLRDPSHAACLSAEQWQQELYAAGFTLQRLEEGQMPIDFASWTQRMHVPLDDRVRLEAMLRQAPEAVRAVLTPQFQDARIQFHLQRIILIASC